MGKLPDKQLLTVQEVAEAAGCAPTWVRRLLLEGIEIKGEKVGHAWIILRVDAAKWLAKRKGG